MAKDYPLLASAVLLLTLLLPQGRKKATMRSNEDFAELPQNLSKQKDGLPWTDSISEQRLLKVLANHDSSVATSLPVQTHYMGRAWVRVNTDGFSTLDSYNRAGFQ
ncbi:Protein of unknown function [Gryllus bimaculatus]|nr:Protein of unknown function [Gryllus bimaculatus]